MSERSGWDLLQTFLLTGALMAVAYSGPPGGASGLSPTSSSSFRHSSPVVYVQDSSGSRWPVATVAAEWSRRSDVTLRYGRCRSGSPCIRVSARRDPLRSGGVAAYAATTRSSTARPTRATIRLNNTPGLSRVQRRALVCREIGHALGLPYRTGDTTCLSRDAGAPASPSRSDVRALNRLY